MAGYRFCRSDDVPLLVAAHNACWVPHFGDASAVTVDDFKRGVRELGLWASSCMVAFDGDEPIGILIGAKRDGDANCVHRLAVKPGWERRGHGRHLLTSLADKAAILGPPRLVAEIPAEWSDACRFFERSGFVEEARYGDFVLEPTAQGRPNTIDAAAQLAIPVGLDELVESGAFDTARRRAWTRSAASVRARAGEIEGVAIATDRIEAYVLHAPSRSGAGRDVIALDAAAGPHGDALLATLLAIVRAQGARLCVPRVGEADVPFAVLESLGFARVRDVVGYALAR